MSQQHIPMDGTPNFRDLGGYQAACGRQVRFGKLFRSGVLSQLSAADLQRMSALGVATICDFRRQEELDRDPTLLPENEPPGIVHIPIDPGSRTGLLEHLAETGDLGDAARAQDMADFMVSINRSFVLDHGQAYRTMMSEIKTLPEDGALLFHCSAGKDRTGFAAALIYMCLGVPRETILQDYMLTAEYFLPDREISRLAKKYASYGFEKMNPAIIRPMLEVRPEYILEAFKTIDEHYDSTEHFLAQEYSMDDAALNAFRDALLD